MRTDLRRPAAIVLAIGLLALIGLSAQVPRVQAHALLVRSEPAEDAKLIETPQDVTAWFSEPLEPGVSKLRVLRGGGEAVDEGSIDFDPADATKMSVQLREAAGPGFYLVTWETLSRIDGHFRFGSFQFSILNADGSEPAGTRPEAAFDVTGRPTGIAEGAVTKALGLIGAIVVVGGLAAVIFVGLPSAGRLSEEPGRKLREAGQRFLAIIVVPVTLALVLTGAAELWLQARQFGGIDEVGRVLDTEWGERWVLRHAILGVLIVGLVVDGSLRARGLITSALSLLPFLTGGLLYLLLVSVVSHGSAVPAGSFWATTSDFIHLASAAVWIGGLAALAALLVWSRRAIEPDQRPQVLAAALQRFSLMAATSLTLLLATGVFNALVQVSSWSALVDTAYGRALAVKLLLLVPLLAVAGLNAFIFRPRLARKAPEDAAGVEGLRRLLTGTVPLEAALAIAVLSIVGLLTQYTPARIEAEASSTATTLADLQEAGSYDFPLTASDWSWIVAGVLAVIGILSWVWAGYLGSALGTLRTAARITATGLTVIAGIVVLIDLTASNGPPAFEPAVGLRYQASDDRLVLLEIDPFQVGNNRFRATVMTEQEESAEATSVDLQFSRLEDDTPSTEVPTRPAEDGSYVAESQLMETGWWAIGVVLDGKASPTFYLRLDNPSLAPLEYAAPDYPSDPAAEQLFRETVERYQGLHSLKWREELTSGLLQPSGIGAWVITKAESEAPDKVRYHTLSPGSSDYTLIRVGEQSCSQDKGGPWQCSAGGATETFDLDYMEGATAFRRGRREPVDGEMSRVLLFNNPSQAGAWYAWWVGEESGHLQRQAMVAPGHFMLTNFFDQDEPVAIQLPQEADSPGG